MRRLFYIFGMEQFQIQLSEEGAQRLKAQAEQMGVQQEALVSSMVSDCLAVPSDERFDRVSEEVLGQYTELYKKLA